jgi:Transglutaminase-like superfamily
MSIEAMSAKIRAGRLDPGVRGWAIQALKDAGIDGRGGQSVASQASAILDAFRNAVGYVPDPYGAEYIAGAAATLCLKPNLCLNGGDCDDLSVALASLMLSVGIPTQIVKQNFGGDKQEHVLIAIYDGSDWQYADPSLRMALGNAVPAQTEDWVDPMGPVGNLSEVQPEIITLGRPPGLGSVLGYPTTSDAHQLLDTAIYNAQQLDAAYKACTAGFSDATAWAQWGTDLAAMETTLNTLTAYQNTQNAQGATWAESWSYDPVYWDQVRAVIDSQIDLDKRWRDSGTTCDAPTYPSEPQPAPDNDPDQWVYQDANAAIKALNSVAKNVVAPGTIALSGIVTGFALALGGYFALNRLFPVRR